MHWEAEHPDNLIHMSWFSASTVRNRRNLEAQDCIALSDSDDSDEDSDRVRSSADTVEADGEVVHKEALAQGDSSGAPSTRKKMSLPPDPYFLLLLGDGCLDNSDRWVTATEGLL